MSAPGDDEVWRSTASCPGPHWCRVATVISAPSIVFRPVSTVTCVVVATVFVHTPSLYSISNIELSCCHHRNRYPQNWHVEASPLRRPAYKQLIVPVLAHLSPATLSCHLR